MAVACVVEFGWFGWVSRALVSCVSFRAVKHALNPPTLPPTPTPCVPDRYERLEPILMDLSDMTAVAERVITDDLEYLIEKCVDIEKADYAVVCGVQVHNCE